jgi:alpha-1,2-mannosyltransferase
MLAFLSRAILALLVLTATAVLLPQLPSGLLALVFRGVGWLIRRRTRSRREYVIARARSEEEECRASQAKDSTSRSQVEDEEGWEKVDTGERPSSSSGSGATGTEEGNKDDWDGVVGFFHPFWYVVFF